MHRRLCAVCGDRASKRHTFAKSGDDPPVKLCGAECSQAYEMHVGARSHAELVSVPVGGGRVAQVPRLLAAQMHAEAVKAATAPAPQHIGPILQATTAATATKRRRDDEDEPVPAEPERGAAPVVKRPQPLAITPAAIEAALGSFDVAHKLFRNFITPEVQQMSPERLRSIPRAELDRIFALNESLLFHASHVLSFQLADFAALLWRTPSAKDELPVALQLILFYVNTFTFAAIDPDSGEMERKDFSQAERDSLAWHVTRALVSSGAGSTALFVATYSALKSRIYRHSLHGYMSKGMITFVRAAVRLAYETRFTSANLALVQQLMLNREWTEQMFGAGVYIDASTFSGLHTLGSQLVQRYLEAIGKLAKLGEPVDQSSANKLAFRAVRLATILGEWRAMNGESFEQFSAFPQNSPMVIIGIFGGVAEPDKFTVENVDLIVHARRLLRTHPIFRRAGYAMMVALHPPGFENDLFRGDYQPKNVRYKFELVQLLFDEQLAREMPKGWSVPMDDVWKFCLKNDKFLVAWPVYTKGFATKQIEEYMADAELEDSQLIPPRSGYEFSVLLSLIMQWYKERGMILPVDDLNFFYATRSIDMPEHPHWMRKHNYRQNVRFLRILCLLCAWKDASGMPLNIVQLMSVTPLATITTLAAIGYSRANPEPSMSPVRFPLDGILELFRAQNSSTHRFALRRVFTRDRADEFWDRLLDVALQSTRDPLSLIVWLVTEWPGVINTTDDPRFWGLLGRAKPYITTMRDIRLFLELFPTFEYINPFRFEGTSSKFYVVQTFVNEYFDKNALLDEAIRLVNVAISKVQSYEVRAYLEPLITLLGDIEENHDFEAISRVPESALPLSGRRALPPASSSVPPRGRRKAPRASAARTGRK